MHAAAVLLCFAAFAGVCRAQIIANTTDGPVQGLDCGLGVECFLGIPYASAQRFQDPQRLTPRSNVFAATKFSDGCPQNCTIPGQLSAINAPIAPSQSNPQAFSAPSPSQRTA
jgi:hypothetical protein